MKIKIYFLFFLCSAAGCKAQHNFGTEHLSLLRKIEMPSVNGRIDHLAVNLKDMLIYVAALGNNTVEVIDLKNGKSVHTIKGLDEPQGIAYIPSRNELVVANGGNGNCAFYNAETYAILHTLHLNADADNVRYDSISGKIYVGYGNGGIAIIDANKHQQIGNIILPAHPEGFQIDPTRQQLYVNVPAAKSIINIDLKEQEILNSWKAKGLQSNFPMALDLPHHQIIAGYRHPAVMVVYDYTKGREITRTELVSDVDDIFYDDTSQEVYASGGGGAINIFKRDSSGWYSKVSDIATSSGARTSLLIPSLHLYLLAERANGNSHAAIAVYKIKDAK